ncbi:molybdate transport system substrate-binding protein [Pelagibacterium luteolum]|uniref:Molybdate transport system substrate-binding protein n=2 Tax=Pelagibacterium luteolum TaxID=440168 RepID=A0A1G7WSX9_9HYPH|nr:molybdate ABC transporter substrate-binding protein [Pelagibacterium luteolum]SDG74370.1 molybdate transport system substrate-binding protein [Pelagibacterium luteolum]
MRLASSAVIAASTFMAFGAVQAQDAQIAVAANFTAAAEELGAAFSTETGQSIAFSFGATGQFYAQITQGAPFDALLSADSATPARLVNEGIGVIGSEFTYAIGKLVLFSIEPDTVTGPQSLEGDFERLAIAEPAAAPYGAAALEVIAALGLTEVLADRLVIGQNISQAYQFVATGNAELGFVALSQIADRDDGSRWIVDEDLYAPITQDALLLSADNAAAAEFLAFLGSETGRAIIASYGYGFTE